MPETGDHLSDPIDTPDEPWTYTLTIPNDPRAVTICRRTLRLILTLHGLPHLIETAELAATELVTNAVRHTKGPAAMTLRWAAPVLRITVWDTDPRLPAPATAPLGPAPETGRGLTLVDACAEHWGWFASVVTAEPDRANGKFVWCELTAAA